MEGFGVFFGGVWGGLGGFEVVLGGFGGFWGGFSGLGALGVL